MQQAFQWLKTPTVMPSANADSRPIVSYKPFPSAKIEVGRRAVIIPVNHYSATWVTNGRETITTAVLAYDKESGDFETRNTRYVMDRGYEH